MESLSPRTRNILFGAMAAVSISAIVAANGGISFADVTLFTGFFAAALFTVLAVTKPWGRPRRILVASAAWATHFGTFVFASGYDPLFAAIPATWFTGAFIGFLLLIRRRAVKKAPETKSHI